jgi:acetoin utilization protein AcuB
MIVRDIMTAKLITVEPDDTLGHAANLLRQYQFHHLPVARSVVLAVSEGSECGANRSKLLLEGILTSSDIDMAVAVANQGTSGNALGTPWQQRRVAEVMHRAAIRVTPITSVASAAQLLVERGLNYLPVVEYGQDEKETRTILVGLITRSDLLIALARSMGAFEPGMQLDIILPMGNMQALAETLNIATDLHMHIRSIIAAPFADGIPHVATIRLGTINPSPFLVRLQEAGIQYAFANSVGEGGSYV